MAMASGARRTRLGAQLMDSWGVVNSFFACWGAQDVELAVMHFHDEMVYELHSATREPPYTGVTRGKAACRDVLFDILKDFDYLKYDPHIHSVEGDIVRAQVSFIYRHRSSGEVLTGTRTLVMRIEDNLIIRMDRYHDAPLVEAFMRLTQHHTTTNQIARLLEPQNAIRLARCGLGPVDPPKANDRNSLLRRYRRALPHSGRGGTRVDNHAIVASWIACWAAQDVEMTLAHLHQDIVYKVHASVLPFGGEKRGQEALRDLMFTVLTDFDVLLYAPTFIRVNGNGARAHVSYIYRHRDTGEVLEGTRRLLIQIRDGLILRIDGYYDDRMVEAFMRLTQYRIATNQIVRAPELPKRETQGSA